jgi:chaperonin cofactor prefoldin
VRALLSVTSPPSVASPCQSRRLTRAIQEFASLTPNSTVYKLVGLVLVKQDTADARLNVESRLGFIRLEMCVFLSR